jgi:hypothetical protein
MLLWAPEPMNGIPVPEDGIVFYTLIAMLYFIIVLKAREESGSPADCSVT